MEKKYEDIRVWLKNNSYEDVAALIDEIMLDWKRKGVKTRRNWWIILAGDKNGHPRTLYGKKFPVLKAAQIRQGVRVTDNAICRNDDEAIPIIRKTNRWPNKE